ncbi:MAG: sigma-54 dependent transcriptional regulator [Calditrichia bacterium]
MKIRILIVDDEQDALELMKELFDQHGYEVFVATNGLEALRVLPEAEPDIIISDLVMPEMDGMKLLEIVHEKYPHIIMIMMTAHGTIETAVEAMRKGAKDYILKPLRLDELVAKVENFSQIKSLQKENEILREKLERKFHFQNIIGKNKKMLEIFELIKDIAQTSSTVLIRGESGTGKELIANAIHFNSERAKKPFIKVNCAVLNENLLESELFGHVKGAFTGAIKDKVGRFEMANHGTIFLDEIGDISPNMQLKLLRVLQEGEFEKVGGTETIKVDVRVVAATNKNLEEAMQKGEFRQDLYYRLNVIPIFVPPLRARKDDIPLLVDYFIDKYSTLFKKTIRGISDEAQQVLINYEWPGNIRELENVIERAIVLIKSEIISVKDLPDHIHHSKTISTASIDDANGNLQDIVEEYEKNIILNALEQNNHNKLQTAKALGLHRSTFMSKLKKYGIS